MDTAFRSAADVMTFGFLNYLDPYQAKQLKLLRSKHKAAALIGDVGGLFMTYAIASGATKGVKGGSEPDNIVNAKSNMGVLESKSFSGSDPFKNVHFKKSDIKMVNDAANEVGIDRKLFGNYIHEIKQDLGMKANQNFAYQQLFKIAKELLNSMQ